MGASGGVLDLSAAEIPARHLGDPTGFGSVVAFLCSGQPRFVTGANVQVDGAGFKGLLWSQVRVAAVGLVFSEIDSVSPHLSLAASEFGAPMCWGCGR